MAVMKNVLIKTLGGLEFLSGYGKEAPKTGWICRTVHDLSRHFRERLEATDERKQCVKRLFDHFGTVTVEQGTDHLQGTQSAPFLVLPNEYTYPSDLLATAALNHWVFPENPNLVEAPAGRGNTDSIICLGSTVNNPVHRYYLGHPSNPNTVVQVPNCYRAELHWNYVEPPDSEIILNWQAGRQEPWQEKNWYIRSKEGREFIPKPDAKGLMKVDYLLITRLPRQAPRGSFKTVLLIGGTHGAGTQGIQLVLKQLDLRQLKYMLDVIGDTPYFQALFKLEGISEVASSKLFPVDNPQLSLYCKEASFHSIATEVDLVKILPLKIEC